MAIISFRRRTFLSPASTSTNSHILAEIESSEDGANRWTTNLIILADCKRCIQLEFFLGTKRDRRLSLRKINLLVETLTAYRDALLKEIELIEKAE